MKATLRRWWRQLTSMRTALVLLLFLAIAAVPGSIWPQRNVSIEQVNQYVAQNPTLAPTLDRLWAFDLAVVRRDLPAAVHVLGGLSRAADA